MTSRALLTVLLALTGACASGPRFRPTRPLVTTSDQDPVAVELTGVETRLDETAFVLAARVSAPEGTALRGVTLARPSTLPCEEEDEPAAVLSLDGVEDWGRPIPVVGEHQLSMRFPLTLGRSARLEGPLAVDVATTLAGVAGCARISVQDERSGATWTPVSPWMVGLRIDLAPLAFGLRAGRMLGPVVVGLEDTISQRWSTAAAVASAYVYENLGLEASYAARWALPGGVPPSGTFQNGPRLRVFYGQDVAPRFDGRRVVVSGFGVELARWWAAGNQPASTELILGITAWLDPRTTPF